MKLSIIIPLYNKEKYIHRCLDSLIHQDISLNEYEIIIVDDGSTDSSYSIAKNYVEKHVHVHLFRQKNGGAGAARNKGLEKASGDYVYFLDADDYIAGNVLNCLVTLAEDNKLEILGFNTYYAEDGSLTDTSTENPYDLSVQVLDGISFIAERNFRNEAWWYIINKKFLVDLDIKFTEGRFLQDSIFTGSLLLKTNRMAKANFDVHRFVKVEGSATTNKKPAHLLKFIEDIVYAVEKFDALIKGLDSSHPNYQKVVKVYRAKQQSFVFSLLIKVFRCPLMKIKDLKKLLNKLNKLEVYPINRKIGGIGNNKTKLIYNLFFLPVLNNKTLLLITLRIKRLIRP